MDHGVEAVESNKSQIGFWRVLFPIEAVRLKHGNVKNNKYSRFPLIRDVAKKCLLMIGFRKPTIKNVKEQSQFFDKMLSKIAEIAIQSGVSPSEVFFKKGCRHREVAP
jgi:hypothetical protein